MEAPVVGHLMGRYWLCRVPLNAARWTALGLLALFLHVPSPVEPTASSGERLRWQLTLSAVVVNANGTMVTLTARLALMGLKTVQLIALGSGGHGWMTAQRAG